MGGYCQVAMSKALQQVRQTRFCPSLSQAVLRADRRLGRLDPLAGRDGASVPAGTVRGEATPVGP